MSDANDVLDALPPDVDDCSATAEVAALKALWGKSAFRMLEDMGLTWSVGGSEIEIVEAVQRFIADKYLYAKSALGGSLDDTRAWRALTSDRRLELMALCCSGCGELWTEAFTRCHCQNDE